MFEKELYYKAFVRNLYFLYIYQGAIQHCLKGDVLTVPYRVQNTWYSADLPIANLVDIRMPCLQGSVTRKVIYRERDK